MKIKVICSLLTLIALVLFLFSGCQIDNIQRNSPLASANSEDNPLLEMPEVKQVITEISAKIEAGELKPGTQKESRNPYDITLNPSGPIVTTSTIVSVTATASPGQIVGQWYLYKEPNLNTPLELIASVPPYPTVKTIDINVSVYGGGVFRISALVFSSTGVHFISSWPISITLKKDPVPVSISGPSVLTGNISPVWTVKIPSSVQNYSIHYTVQRGNEASFSWDSTSTICSFSPGMPGQTLKIRVTVTAPGYTPGTASFTAVNNYGM